MTEHTPVASPMLERVRHEVMRRSLTVSKAERLTPHMHRITLTGDDLASFVSLSPDDHVKLILPGAVEERRDYTPRRFDANTRELVLDFAVHDAGPATLWALAAQPGDTLTVGGPRGSQVITGKIAHWLLIGDETALPAIGRRIEESAAGSSVTALVAVPTVADEQSFLTQAALNIHWVCRSPDDADDPAALLAALRNLTVAPGTFIWIAAEATVARALRRYLIEDRSYPINWIKASGYWVKGKADTTESFPESP